jgi:outer membrane immunogenic protein
MRHVVLGFVSAAALAVSAHAADIYTPAPVGGMKDEYVPGINWTGFYLGAGGGGGATSQDLKAIFSSAAGGGGSAFAEADGIGGMGGFGTLQVGYDRQFLPRWVAGVFFDYDFDSIDSSFKVGATGLGTLKFPFNLTDQWTVGGRVGYLVNPYTLVYGLGGYTEAHFDLPTGTHNGTFSGFSAGAGIETNLMGSWFLKGEYRFSGFESQTIFGADFGACSVGNVRVSPCNHFRVTDQPDVQTGRLVLSYKFNAFGSEPLK